MLSLGNPDNVDSHSVVLSGMSEILRPLKRKTGALFVSDEKAQR